MKRWQWTDAVSGTSIFPDGRTKTSMASTCVPYAGAELILRQDVFTPNLYNVILACGERGNPARIYRIDTFMLSRADAKSKNYTRFSIKAKSLDEAKSKVAATLKKAIAYITSQNNRTYIDISKKLFSPNKK
jgi:hypothetical protein